MTALTLRLLDDTFSIHSLAVDSKIPSEVFEASVYFIGKTFEEISIVLPSSITLNSEDCEPDWQAFEVVGPLDFILTGILSSISTVLANEKISIFAVSTFDTDYILVKSNKVDDAISTLRNNNFQVI